MLEAMLAASAIGLFAAILLSTEIGFRIGRRWRNRHPGIAPAGGTGVEAAVLGLLGLTLALSFSGGADRLAARRAQIVQEANSIGTAWLRLDLLAEADQPALRALFRQYLDSRIEVYERFAERERSDAALARAAGLQQQVWAQAVASCPRSAVAAACMLLMPALNEMFDIANTRTLAQQMKLPRLIVGLLVLLCCLGGVLSGYSMSGQGERSALHTAVFTIAIAATVYVVLDLEYPRGGLINLEALDQAIVTLRASIH